MRVGPTSVGCAVGIGVAVAATAVSVALMEVAVLNTNGFAVADAIAFDPGGAKIQNPNSQHD